MALTDELPAAPTDQPQPQQPLSLQPELVSLTSQQAEEPVSLLGQNAPPPVSPQVAQDRAAKHDYALGDKSPGKDAIQNRILAGDEQNLRWNVVGDDMVDTELAKQEMIQYMAAHGKQLTPDETSIVMGLTKAELRKDPRTILEQKFAEKYIQDVSTTVPNWYEQGFYDPHVQTDQTIGADVVTYNQFLSNRINDLEAERHNQSWLRWGADQVTSLVPFVSWYRQAQALQERPTMLENWGMGNTMAANIMYIYKLPLKERVEVTERAIKHMKEIGNMEDVMTFVNGLRSFSTTDRYIANAISIADYTTLGAPVAKALTRAVAGGPKAIKALEAIREIEVPPPQMVRRGFTPDNYFGSYDYKVQGELPFPEPRDLFEATYGPGRTLPTDAGAPLLESKLPPGKVRATHVTDQKTYQGEQGTYDLANRNVPLGPKGEFRGPQGRFAKSTEGMQQREMFPRPGSRTDTGQFQKGVDLGTRPPEEPTQLGLGLRQVEHPLGDLNLPVIRSHEIVPSNPELVPVPKVRPGAPPPTEGQQQFKQVMAAAIKAMGTETPNIGDVMGHIGEHGTGAALKALEAIGRSTTEGLGAVSQQIKHTLNLENWLRGGHVIPNGLVEEYGARLGRQSKEFIDNFVQLARVNRLPPEALSLALDRVKANLIRDYGRFGKNNSFVHTPADEHFANVDHMSYLIRRPDGELFDSEAQAVMFRDEHFQLKSEAMPRPQGKGWYLEVTRPINEKEPDVQRLMNTIENKTPVREFGFLSRWLRTSKDILGTLQNENRVVATHAQQEVHEMFRAWAKKDIGPLSKREKNEVTDMLIYNRDNPPPGNPNAERGFWYNNAGEFESAFVQKHGKLPTQQQVIAYNTYHRMQDMELLLENASVFRDKSILGVTQSKFKFMQGGKAVDSPWFEGIRLDKMDWARGNAIRQDAGIWVQDGENGKFFYKYGENLDRKYIDDLIENRGFSVVQVFEPTKHPLEGLAKTAGDDWLKEQVNYIISNTWDHKPLSFNQVNYRAGPHSMYVHKYYVSQPVIKVGRNGKRTFYGDNNALNVQTQAQAQKWSDHLETGRKILLTQDDVALANHLKTGPYSVEQFKDLFRRNDSPFDMHTPITYKERGKTTFDTDTHLKSDAYRDVIDGRKNVHDPSNNMDKSFLMDRDEVINTINEKTMQLNPALQLDPLTTLNNVIGQRIRNVWTNDYKIAAINNWIAQFSHVLKADETTLLGHPMYFLFHPEFKNVGEIARGDLAAAKASRLAILHFVGAKSEFAKDMDHLKMSLLNNVYNAVGQGRLLDLAISTTADPVAWMRAAAFHSKLGLFNPVQLFLQANQMAHSIAVSGPKHGIAGMSAAFMMRRLGHNPLAVDLAAKNMRAFGWTADEFKDMYEAFRKTGLYRVGGEVISRDLEEPRIFQHAMGKFLDAGSYFFNEGERMGRLTAFATAYKDFRKLQPTGKIGNRELAKIMNRMDDLASNMTVASRSAWQRGVASIPTQFATWTVRMQEQMLGGLWHDITGKGVAGRLTGIEKLRMLAVYSTLYGAPIGIGTAVGGVWPMYDSIQQEAMKRGIDINKGWFEPFSQGIIETGMHYLLGQQYNVSQRFGPGNNDMVTKALFGDKPFHEVMLGASGTIIGDFLKSMMPWYYYATNQTDFSTAGASDSLLQAARNISVADNAVKIAGILNYGNWWTKTGTLVDTKVNGMDAAMVAFGLSPLSVSQTFLGRAALKDEANTKMYYANQFVELKRRAFTAASKGDYSLAHALFSQANSMVVLGDLSWEQEKAAQQRVLHENMSLFNKVKWDLLNKAGPSRLKTMMENQ